MWINLRTRMLKYPSSKWLKHRVLSQNEELAPILPATTVFHEAALHDYFLEFPTVYVKPIHGSGGNHVMKVTKNDQEYTVQTKRRTVRFNKENQVFAYIRKQTRGRKYIIQQGIDLIHLDGSPIDFRVLLFKRNHAWHWYGIIGRMGKTGAVVTNRAQGGKAISFTEALSRSFEWNEEQMEEMKARIQHVSMTVAHTLGRYFPNMNQLGLDLSVDTQGNLYLIEANTRPHYRLFRQHEDRRLFARVSRTVQILRYSGTARGNGNRRPRIRTAAAAGPKKRTRLRKRS